MNPPPDLPGTKDRVVPAATAGAAAVSALAAGRPSAAGPSNELAQILERLPADDYQTAGRLCERLLAGGPAVIKQLVGMVGDESGDPNGVKPKYALHGLAGYASRPGADGQRKLLAETLARELSADHSDELCNPATQALVAIGGRQAMKALRDALPTAGGSREVAIRQAVEILSPKQRENQR